MAKLIKGDAPEQEKHPQPQPEPKPEEQTAPVVPFSQKLEEDAQNYFQEYMESEEGASAFGSRCYEAVAHLGLKALIAKPVRTHNPKECHNLLSSIILGENKIKYVVLPESEKDIWRYFIQKRGGAALLGTDAEEHLLNDPLLLQQYVPEALAFRSQVQQMKERVHPYLAVLSMEPGLRALAAVTIGRRESTRVQTITPAQSITHAQSIFFDPLERISFPTYRDDALGKFELSCFPSLEEITAAAKEYGCREITPTLRALQQVQKLYRSKWR